MSIEKAIHQKKFGNDYEKAVVNILYTASWLDALTIQSLKPFGISPQQFNVLRILRGANPSVLRLADITERMLDKNSNATRLVEKLRQKGLLEREVCPSNRRQVNISITQKGLDLLAEIDKLSSNWIEPLRLLTKAEAQQLNTLLDKLRNNDE
jgi:DNA-binding MarR family transcriptional regulator